MNIPNELRAALAAADDAYLTGLSNKGTVNRAKKDLEKLTPTAEAAGEMVVVTMGGDGAVYADMHGDKGYCPARKVAVKDTTGAGDSFCAGVAIGLTYGKTLAEACEIGAHLAASVIVTSENVCPRFLPRELGLDMDVVD